MVALAACGGGSGPPATELRFWAMGREGEVVQQLLPAFEQAHPGVRVRVQQIPWSAAHEKLLTAFVGGSMPDVFQAGTTWMPELVALGAVRSLPPETDGDEFAGIAAANRIDGRTWRRPGTSTLACCSIGPTACARPVGRTPRVGRAGNRRSTASSDWPEAIAMRCCCPSTNGRPRSVSPSSAALACCAATTNGAISVRTPFVRPSCST
jgi:hypothetical protein